MYPRFIYEKNVDKEKLRFEGLCPLKEEFCFEYGSHLAPCTCPVIDSPPKPKRRKIYMRLIDNQGLSPLEFTVGKAYAIVGSHKWPECVRAISERGHALPVAAKNFGLKRIKPAQMIVAPPPVITSVYKEVVNGTQRMPESLETFRERWAREMAWLDAERLSNNHRFNCVDANRGKWAYHCICDAHDKPDPTG